MLWGAEGADYGLYQLVTTRQDGCHLEWPILNEWLPALKQLSYQIEVDGAVVASFLHEGTGGWQNWQRIEAKHVVLEEGAHTVRIFGLL